jgi:hypothetical protein
MNRRYKVIVMIQALFALACFVINCTMDKIFNRSIDKTQTH